MRNKLFKNIFIASMTVFLLCFILILGALYSYFTDRSSNEVRNEALYLAAVAEEYGTDFFEHLDTDASSRITIIAADGTVISDSEEAPEGIENQSTAPEVVDALKEGTGESSRFSKKSNQEMINYAVRLYDGSVLRVTSVQYTRFMLLVDMIYPIVMIITAAIIMSVFIASRVSRSITEPILKIDLNNPDERDVYDELKPFISNIRAKNAQIYSQIEQMRSEHEKQDIMRREFTANVSHELKTPLTSISGTAEIIRSGLVKPEDIPHFADNIYNEAGRMISLVNDIMELSRLDENAVSAPFESVDLYEVSSDVISRLSHYSDKRRIRMHLEGGSTIIPGVRKLIDEIIYNLCDNAIKYNKDGGSVTVALADYPDKAELSVADTGIGIPEDSIDRIFERFFRVDKSHSKEIGGTGLGLSIVKHGVKYHGADITVESKVDNGTKISITFRKN